MRLAVLICIAACANNTPQNKQTSKDGRFTGAKPLALGDDGTVSEHGIVTYPGGDRVDWKSIELPEKKTGTLEIKLTWTTPRPNLRLGFDVFDKYNALIAPAKKERHGYTRTQTIENAKGKYLIRVYALRRGDAGTYKLDVNFTPPIADTGIDWPKVVVAEPPRLPDLPTVVVSEPCDANKVPFDYSNPGCATVCPTTNPRKGWKGCKGQCTVTPPDPGIPECAKDMVCDLRALDRRIPSCLKHFPKPCPDPRNPDPNNPNCDGVEIPPVMGRIQGHTVISNTEVEILISVGTSSRIDPTWTAAVVDGSNKVIGTIKITRMDTSNTRGRVSLTAQQVTTNKNVLFTPPPKPKP